MLPEFEAAAIGMKAGETKSFDMTFPEDYRSKEVAGKKVTFTITLNQCRSTEACRKWMPNLPSLSESLTVMWASLQDEIRSNLLSEVSRRLKARNKDAAMEALLRVARFDVPKVLVE